MYEGRQWTLYAYLRTKVAEIVASKRHHRGRVLFALGRKLGVRRILRAYAFTLAVKDEETSDFEMTRRVAESALRPERAFLRRQTVFSRFRLKAFD